MSDAATTKQTPKDKALAHIKAVVSKYKIVKIPTLVQSTVKAVYGDLKDAPDDKVNKATTNISNLLNSLIEEDEIRVFTFVRTLQVEGEPSIINESIVVEGGFEIAGYEPTRMEETEQPDVIEDDVLSDDDEDDEDGEATENVSSSMFADRQATINRLVRESHSGFLIVNCRNTEEKQIRELHLRHTPSAALGKFLSLSGENEDNSVELFALMHVDLEIDTIMGEKLEIEETEEEGQHETT